MGKVSADARQSLVSYSEWVVALLVLIAAFTIWTQVRVIDAAELGIYDIFPLFGIVAYSIMWTHFLFGAIRRYIDAPRPKKHLYSTASMGVVLAMLILHPGLLWFALWRDGFGLPPVSYLTVYSSQILAVILGTIGLSIFLAYELKRLYGDKQWRKYIEYLQIIGMIAIFYHALELGGELDVGWFRTLWWAYFITFVVAVCYTTITKLRGEKGE